MLIGASGGPSGGKPSWPKKTFDSQMVHTSQHSVPIWNSSGNDLWPVTRGSYGSQVSVLHLFPRKCAKKEQGSQAGHVDCDAPLSKVQKKPIKDNVNQEMPTIRSLKLRQLPDQYVAGGGFFYHVAQSLYALSNNTPLIDTHHQVQASVLYRERCGTQVVETALSVCRDPHKETSGDRPQGGGLRNHFASPANNVGINVPLLPTNTCNIATSSFGMDTTVTSAAIWQPGHDVPYGVHGREDMLLSIAKRQW